MDNTAACPNCQGCGCPTCGGFGCITPPVYDQETIYHPEKKPIGFILLIEYPGCRKHVGAFEPLTTGEFLKYPLIWKPVYK